MRATFRTGARLEVVDAPGSGAWPEYEVPDEAEAMARRCAAKAAEQCGPGGRPGEAWADAYTRAMLTAMRPEGELAARLQSALAEAVGFVWTGEPWNKKGEQDERSKL